MNVVVIHESRSGNTKRAAELIGGIARELDAEVAVFPAAAVGWAELAAADLAFVGTWTDGIIVAGHRPGGSRRLNAMPDLWHKPVAPFVTYAVNPGRVISKLGNLLARKGAEVLPGRAFHRSRLDDGLIAWVAESMDRVTIGQSPKSA